LVLTATYEERGVSGSVPLAQRPEGGRLLEALQVGDTIIVTKLDRGFRDSLDALAVWKLCQQKGVALHMLDMGGDVINSPIAKMMFTMLAAMAEFERNRIRERINEGKATQKSKGMFGGGTVPFGYAKVLIDPAAKKPKYQLAPVPEQQAAIIRMRQMHQNGMPLRTIAAELAKDGITLSHIGVRAALQQADIIAA
jgi:DNA invertase Pin-like site-specific DNA recombinase